MKKILFLAQLPPPVHGAAVMNEILVRSKVLNQTFQTSVLPINFTREIKEIGAFSIAKLFRMIALVARLLVALSNRPHLVYLTLTPSGTAFYRDMILILIIKISGRKMVYHLHGQGIDRRYQSRKFDRHLLKMAFRNTSVICLSDQLVDDIKRVCVSEPYIVPNGLPHSGNAPIFESNTPLKLIYLSNLIKEKGVLCFLECLKKLHELDVKVQALIVGEEYDVTNKFIQSYLDQNNLDNCRITGALYNREKADILSESDILILPTFNDSFPLVILEAMQAGLVVIASKVGGIPDMIEDQVSGFLTEPGDVSKITEIVGHLCDDPNSMIDIKKKAYQRFQSYYTVEHFENNMLRVFGQIIG